MHASVFVALYQQDVRDGCLEIVVRFTKSVVSLNLLDWIICSECGISERHIFHAYQVRQCDSFQSHLPDIVVPPYAGK